MHPRLTGILLAAAATAAVPATAQAKHPTYKVVSVTHTSSSAKRDEHYTGTSTSTWEAAQVGQALHLVLNAR